MHLNVSECVRVYNIDIHARCMRLNASKMHTQAQLGAANEVFEDVCNLRVLRFAGIGLQNGTIVQASLQKHLAQASDLFAALSILTAFFCIHTHFTSIRRR